MLGYVLIQLPRIPQFDWMMMMPAFHWVVLAFSNTETVSASFLVSTPILEDNWTGVAAADCRLAVDCRIKPSTKKPL